MFFEMQKEKVLMMVIIFFILKSSFVLAELTEKWSYPIGDWVKSSPAIGSDGTVYIGSNDKNLYAIDPNGNEKWRYPTGSSIESSPAIGSDGTVYVGSDDKYLYAIDPIDPNGNEKWRYETGQKVRSSPAIGSDGTVYVGSHDKNLYAIDPNGNWKWKYETGDWITSSPAIGSDGTVYVGSDDKNLYAIDPNGNRKWRYETGDLVRSSPAIGSDGTVYVGSYDGNLYAIDPNGNKKWHYTTGDWVISSPAIGSDGMIYVGSSFDVHAIDPNGNPKPGYTTYNYFDDSSPAIGSDGTIYIANNLKLFAICSDSYGLLDSLWPMFHHDVRHTGAWQAEKIERTMNIPEGWIMISLPVATDSPAMLSLFQGAGVIYGYKKGMGYVRVKNNEGMKVGKGYWIFLDKEKTYILKGHSINHYTLSANEDIWQMIGGCSSSAKASSTNCSIEVYGYEPGYGYKQILPIFDEFLLDPGKGYWMLLKNVTGQAKVTVQITGNNS